MNDDTGPNTPLSSPTPTPDSALERNREGAKDHKRKQKRPGLAESLTNLFIVIPVTLLSWLALFGVYVVVASAFVDSPSFPPWWTLVPVGVAVFELSWRRLRDY